MSDFLKSFKFIIGFFILTFLVQTAFGEKASEKFALIVLFTMVILNATKFTDFLQSAFVLKSSNSTEQKSNETMGSVTTGSTGIGNATNNVINGMIGG